MQHLGVVLICFAVFSKLDVLGAPQAIPRLFCSHLVFFGRAWVSSGMVLRFSVGFAEMVANDQVNSGRSNRYCPAKRLALLLGQIFFQEFAWPSWPCKELGEENKMFPKERYRVFKTC